MGTGHGVLVSTPLGPLELLYDLLRTALAPHGAPGGWGPQVGAAGGWGPQVGGGPRWVTHESYLTGSLLMRPPNEDHLER